MKTKRKDKKDGPRKARRDHSDSGPGGGSDGDASGARSGTLTSAVDPWPRLTGLGSIIAEPAEQPEHPPLPERVQTDLLTGWKRTTVGFNDGVFSLQGVGYSKSYGVEAVASCDHGGLSFYALMNRQMSASIFGSPREPQKVHDAPDPHCQCGFHLFATKAEAEAIESSYPTPFLLQVEAYGRVIRHAKGFRAQKQRVLAVEVRRRCHFCPQDSEYLAHKEKSLRPMCGRHVEPYQWITAGDLAELLCTEVRWSE